MKLVSSEAHYYQWDRSYEAKMYEESMAMERLLSGHPTMAELEAGLARVAEAMNKGAKHE